MRMAYEASLDPRNIACNELFAWCCKHDDKSPAQQRMKHEEERGEFFREYLIWDCKRTNVVAMAHRETTLAAIHEEMADCVITSSRVEGWHEFFFVEPEPNYEPSYARFAQLLRDGNVLFMIQEACALMGIEEFYRLMTAKLNKWKSCLLLNGLESV